MPRYSVSRNNFLGGELSGKSDGRSDLQQYQLGCKQIRNFIVMPNGGVTKRPGTIHVDDVDDDATVGVTATNQLKLIPFVFSESESYVSCIWTDSNGKNKLRVINTSGTDETVNVSTQVRDEEASVVFMQNAQSGDVNVLCSSEQRPWILFRTNRGNVDLGLAYDFSLVDYLDGTGFGADDTTANLYKRMPFRDDNADSTLQLDASGVTGSISIVANFDAFTSDSVGAYYRIKTGYVKITTYTDENNVGATVIKDLPDHVITDDWAEGAWSGRRGWPRSVTFYNGRLVFGGNDSQPDTFWMSQVGDYFEFEPIGTGVDDAMNFSLTSQRVNQIQWMVGGKKLVIGTSGSEHVGVVEEDGTNLKVQFGEETAHGSSYIQAKRVGGTIPFVQQSAHSVRELIFDYASDSYIGNDLTLLKDDIAKGYYDLLYDENYIMGMAYMDAPIPILWLYDAAGKLYGVTRDRSQQITSWHSHVIAGTVREEDISALEGPDHPGRVMSITCIPAGDNSGYRLYLVVQRYIDGELRYYIEYMDRFRDLDQLAFNGSSGANYYYFLDSAKHAYASPAAGSFSGFDHLEGETVGVMADGKWYGEVTVGSGAINLTGIQANAIVAGLRYNSRLKTARTEGGSAIGSSIGAPRRVDQIRMNLYQTRFFKFGFECAAKRREEIEGTDEATQEDYYDSRLEDHSYVDPGEIPNEPYYTESGIVTKAAPAGYDDKGIAIILSDRPYPCTILGITTRAIEHDV